MLRSEIEKSSTHEFELAGQNIDPVELDSSLTYYSSKELGQIRVLIGFL